MILVRVVAPHFVAGIELENDRVVRAAPILAWTVGRDRAWLRAYFLKKGWRASVIEKSSDLPPIEIDAPDRLSDKALSVA